MNYQETKALMQEYDFEPTRSLGQNFLVDDRVVLRISQLLAADADDLVLEIGPGLGALTKQLLVSAGTVLAIEIDRKIVPALRANLANFSNFSLINEDALAIDLSELVGVDASFKIAANLPYYITTKLLEKLLTELKQAKIIVLMMQKEAADRILARPANKKYGPVSVLLMLFGRAKKKFRVPANAFLPAPKVESQVIEIISSRLDQTAEYGENIAKPENLAYHDLTVESAKEFLRFLHLCFSQRRKKLINTLRTTVGIAFADENQEPLEPLNWHDLFAQAAIPAHWRAEQVSPAQFLLLFQLLQTKANHVSS